jgi:hypothetical protein
MQRFITTLTLEGSPGEPTETNRVVSLATAPA